jgi:hypothetical protein
VHFSKLWAWEESRAKPGLRPANDVLGWTTSTWPISSEGSEIIRVRVIGSVSDACENFSNCAPNRWFAWETVRARESQSPFGETTVGFKPFAAAKELKAATVSLDGWTKDLTYRHQN